MVEQQSGENGNLDYGLGRLAQPDDRDLLIWQTPLRIPGSLRISTYWYMGGAWLDQGSRPHCFPPDTPVVMADGSEKPIFDVRAGERVLSHRGRAQMVRAVMARRYVGPLSVVKTHGRKDSLRSTPEHPYLRTSFEPGSYAKKLEARESCWVEAAELAPEAANQKRDYLHVSLARPENCVEVGGALDVTDYLNDVEERDGSVRLPGEGTGSIPRFIEITHGLAWFLGLYLARGSRDRGHGAIDLDLGANEIDLARQAAKAAEASFGVEAHIQACLSDVLIVRAYSAALANLLEMLCGGGASTKRLHPGLWAWSDDLLEALWDGFADGAGDRGRGGENLATVGFQLARDLWRIGMRVGKSPTLTWHDLKDAHSRRVRRYGVAVYPPAHPDGFPRDENFVYAAVEAVGEEPYDGLVFNLEVEGDHSFVADGVAVHNCVGYSWTHWLEDGPVAQPTLLGDAAYADALYKKCQLVDEWPGEDYEGTSVRAGAKVLRSRGLLEAYYFAFDIDSVKLNLLERGPVVVGTNWYKSMFQPEKHDERTYVCKVDGGSGRAGGHAYVLNGIDLDKEIDGVTGFIRLKNSWGRDWAFEGRCFISIDDVDKLLREDGEMCIAVERQA